MVGPVAKVRIKREKAESEREKVVETQPHGNYHRFLACIFQSTTVPISDYAHVILNLR